MSKIRLLNRIVKSSKGILFGLNSSVNLADRPSNGASQYPPSAHTQPVFRCCKDKQFLGFRLGEVLWICHKSIFILYFSDRVESSSSIPMGRYSELLSGSEHTCQPVLTRVIIQKFTQDQTGIPYPQNGNTIIPITILVTILMGFIDKIEHDDLKHKEESGIFQ